MSPAERPGATSAPGPLADARLVGLLDPVAETLRGGFPYSDAPAQLPDGQPALSLRVRRQVGAPGLRVAIDRYRDEQHLAGEELTVDRLPIDRALATPRRRANPMPASTLHLAGDPSASDDAVGLAVAGVGPDGDQRITLPTHGPGPQDVAAVVAAARSHRLVVVEASVSGDPALLAALVLQIVGAGTTCWCPPEVVERFELLSPQLRDLLTFDLAEVAEDDLLLASRTARQKRATWADHDLRLAWRPDTGDAWVPWFQPVPWPSVSVVLPTRRPAAATLALTMMAAQRDVQLEVTVVLHGGGDLAAVDAERQRLGLEGRVLAVPETLPLGAVLNHAVAHSSAPVVLKWDDDDLYGPRHVQDLLVARRQTGASLVGKVAEFVYFDGAGRSVWRAAGRAESDSIGQAGGTLLTDRALLEEVGGYPNVSYAEDHHLKVRLRDRGMHPFRTHGFGFVLRRHGHGHSWDAADERFLANALRTFEGLPEILELGDAARFTTLPAG